MLVYSCGKGVHGFTLDPGVEEFLLSHESIRIPTRGKTYSVNEGNYQKWPSSTQRYIDHLREKAPDDGRPYSSRYIGALVADVHRTLLTGGIYLYPGEAEKPEGKIRLLYESAPMGYVVEQAGGSASTGCSFTRQALKARRLMSFAKGNVSRLTKLADKKVLALSKSRLRD